MNYAERKTIESACYDAWKQAEQSSTTASAALSAAINLKFSSRREAHESGKAWTPDPETQKQLDERREYAAAAVIRAYRAAEAAYKAYQAAQSAYNAIAPTQARRIDGNGPRGLF